MDILSTFPDTASSIVLIYDTITHYKVIMCFSIYLV